MKKPTNEVNIKFLNVTLQLKSEMKGLLDFIYIMNASIINENNNSNPDITVNLKPDKGYTISNNYKKISRNIQIGDSSIFIMKVDRIPGLSLKIKIKDNKINIEAFLKEKKNNLVKILSPWRGFDQSINFMILTYYLIYIPCIYYLEHFRNLYLLHAGAFEYKQKGIILSGLGGVGKSTLTLAALHMNNSKILSDNMIFHDSQKIFSIPSPIGLDLNSLSLLAKISNKLTPIKLPTHHGRTYYQLKPDLFINQAVPKYLFWLQCGNENTIKPIDEKKIIKTLLDINLLTNHIREYLEFAALVDLVSKKISSPAGHFKNLSSLASNLECFVLTFKPGTDACLNFDKLINQIL